MLSEGVYVAHIRNNTKSGNDDKSGKSAHPAVTDEIRSLMLARQKLETLQTLALVLCAASRSYMVFSKSVIIFPTFTSPGGRT